MNVSFKFLAHVGPQLLAAAATSGDDSSSPCKNEKTRVVGATLRPRLINVDLSPSNSTKSKTGIQHGVRQGQDQHRADSSPQCPAHEYTQAHGIAFTTVEVKLFDGAQLGAHCIQGTQFRHL
jgi:hypothetical protein